MALGPARLGHFCDARELAGDSIAPEVYLHAGVEPHRTPGITDQFLADAATYHRRYFAPTHFDHLLRRAFSQVDRPLDSLGTSTVLDLGSGSGNTAIPLVSCNPNIEVIATDLSIDLLRIMAHLVRGRPFEDQLGFICADANEPVFFPGSFDIVVGASILHHLIDPAAAFSTTVAYLKPGGIGIFFEPFEYGCNILKTIYELVLDDPRCRTDLSPHVVDHFRAMIRDYNARFDPTRPKDFTKHLDDKWLFTRNFFANLSREKDCELVMLSGNSDTLSCFFERQLQANLRLAGLHNTAVPDWVFTAARHFDGLPESFKAELIIDGTLVVRKLS